MLNILRLDTHNILDTVVGLLAKGECIISPTDTCYGLLGSGLNKDSIDKIILLKGRKNNTPFYLAVSDIEHASSLVKLTSLSIDLFNAFSDKGIALILEPKIRLSGALLNVEGNLGIRVPPYSFVRTMIKKLGEPVIATSANPSGFASPYSIEDIINQWDENKLSTVPLIIDGGALPPKKTSTIVDLTKKKPVIVREGDVPIGEIIKFL